MTPSRARLFTPVLIGGSIILLINFALRASFGVFQIPIAAEFGWPRTEFSLAIAIQNLAWGIGQPVFGALGERFGDKLSIRDVGLLKVAVELNMARLEEIPRKMAEAQERRVTHDAARRAWLEEQKEFEANKTD